MLHSACQPQFHYATAAARILRRANSHHHVHATPCVSTEPADAAEQQLRRQQVRAEGGGKSTQSSSDTDSGAGNISGRGSIRRAQIPTASSREHSQRKRWKLRLLRRKETPTAETCPAEKIYAQFAAERHAQPDAERPNECLTSSSDLAFAALLRELARVGKGVDLHRSFCRGESL